MKILKGLVLEFMSEGMCVERIVASYQAFRGAPTRSIKPKSDPTRIGARLQGQRTEVPRRAQGRMARRSGEWVRGIAELRAVMLAVSGSRDSRLGVSDGLRSLPLLSKRPRLYKFL